jgi:hypothetical protein
VGPYIQLLCFFIDMRGLLAFLALIIFGHSWATSINCENDEALQPAVVKALKSEITIVEDEWLESLFDVTFPYEFRGHAFLSASLITKVNGKEQVYVPLEVKEHENHLSTWVEVISPAASVMLSIGYEGGGCPYIATFEIKHNKSVQSDPPSAAG